MQNLQSLTHPHTCVRMCARVVDYVFATARFHQFSAFGGVCLFLSPGCSISLFSGGRCWAGELPQSIIFLQEDRPAVVGEEGQADGDGFLCNRVGQGAGSVRRGSIKGIFILSIRSGIVRCACACVGVERLQVLQVCKFLVHFPLPAAFAG